MTRPGARPTPVAGGRRLEGKVAVITGAASGIGRAMAGASPPRGRRWSWPTSTTTPGRRWRATSAASSSATDVTDQQGGGRALLDGGGRASAGSTSAATTPASRPPEDDVDPRDRTSTPGGGSRRSTSPRSTCAAGSASPTCSSAGADRSSTPPRSWPCWARPPARSPTPPPRAACWRCRGSSACEFARQGVRVNALCPGPVNTPLLRELFAAGPRAGGPPPGPRADGPVRRARGDRRRRRLPGLRRRLVRHRLDLHGRRRHPRRLRHAPVSRPTGRARSGTRGENPSRATMTGRGRVGRGVFERHGV